MNSVTLIGRLTKDPVLRYTAESQMPVARFSIAVDRFTKGEKKTDFPNIVCFDKTAENVERFLKKGSQVGIQGRIQTGSYTNNDGAKVYTTEVVADRVDFIGAKEEQEQPVPTGFKTADEDIPF